MFKKILFGSLIPTIVAISPIAITSCNELPKGSINKGEQEELLVSDAAKNTFLDSWITNTFVSLYVNENYSNLDSKDSKSKIANSYKYYLDHLSWPIASNEYQDIESNKKTEFENLIKESYKFYISFKSTIKESGDKPLPPISYFFSKANQWQKNELKTINAVKDTSGKLLTINDFNPSINYTGLDSSSQIIDNDFKILMQTRGTLVYQNVMKLLLSEMYFLKNNENLIKNGTNFKKMTNDPNSVNYINNIAYVEGENNFSTFMLKKYIVESSPQFLWSYSSEDYSDKTTSASIISTLSEFNNLKVNKELSLKKILSPNSTESETNSIDKLKAFNKLELSTSSDSGDLSVNLDNIKMYGDSKVGLLDNEKKLLFTFTELNAIKEARKYNKTNSNALMIPSINIKETSKTSKSYSIKIEDLDVSWGGVSSTSMTDNSFIYTKDTITQTLIINSISFLPTNSNKKTINISFTYKFKTTNEANSEYSFNHNFELSNWGSSDGSPSNPFANASYFTGEENQVGIKIFDGEKPAGISYYLRPLPIFKRNNVNIIGSERYMVGKWSFENTPWSTLESQKKLIHFFTLADENLYRKIQDFYLFNNFDVVGATPELKTIISNLNLTKKTHQDRLNEGIL